MVNKTHLDGTPKEELVSICEWMITERTVDICDVRCFDPRAFCWHSGKSVFLRKATRVTTLVEGAGYPIKQLFYFVPKQYTVYTLLK